jgi:uncharacterized lipoprotein YehR (DUF1307 family)
MKKTIRVLALVMALSMVLVVFAACGKTISGTYSAELLGTGATYEFKGNKVTVTYKALGQVGFEAEGTYKIKDDKITFTFESDDKDAKDYNGTFDFEEGEDYIKIGVIKYTKK